MQTLRMKTGLLEEFLTALRGWGRVWAPVEREHGLYSLEVVDDDVTRARPEALRTIVPFKKLLLKPRFSMLRSEGGGNPVECDENDAGRQVFLGAHACDIHALKILDLLYLSDFPDPYYRRNRQQLVVIGFGCWPDERCFCESLNTSSANDGFDLFLTQLENCFQVVVGSSVGDDIVCANRHLFEPATRQDTRQYLERLREREAAFTLELDVTDLPFVLELKREDPVWDELGRKCLCCGSCSIVCPTCSCFNVMDEVTAEGGAARLRSWDSCLFRDYAMVAGGHNFRGDRGERVRNRYYHKQEAFVREFGMPSCVGCGRCIENCPTGINVVEVFQHVRGTV
jgi:sulfhydrogenase subunit beta (sulfur reductase)